MSGVGGRASTRAVEGGPAHGIDAGGAPRFLAAHPCRSAEELVQLHMNRCVRMRAPSHAMKHIAAAVSQAIGKCCEAAGAVPPSVHVGRPGRAAARSNAHARATQRAHATLLGLGLHRAPPRAVVSLSVQLSSAELYMAAAHRQQQPLLPSPANPRRAEAPTTPAGALGVGGRETHQQASRREGSPVRAANTHRCRCRRCRHYSQPCSNEQDH